MMRIAYDHQIFGWQKYGGISRYFLELAAQLAMDEAQDVRIISPIYVNRYLAERRRSLRVCGMPIAQLPRTGRIYRSINSILAPLAMRRFRPQVVHETYYARTSVAPTGSARVLTVFDMIHERFPDDYSRLNPTRYDKAKSVARADHIICISDSTRRDLVDILGVPEEKTSVVHLASSLQCVPPARFPASMESVPYILYVGLRSGYKNFARLLAAYAGSPRLVKHFRLVCFGGGAFTSAELRRFDEVRLPRERIMQLSGDDALLAGTYAKAAVFVYPSCYEGFGIPPLEAMSLGCPVACSNTSSLPEVVGDAAELFDPLDEAELRGAIERIVDSRETAQRLIATGYARAARFSWRNCAEQTLKIYRGLAAD